MPRFKTGKIIASPAVVFSMTISPFSLFLTVYVALVLFEMVKLTFISLPHSTDPISSIMISDGILTTLNEATSLEAVWFSSPEFITVILYSPELSFEIAASSVS